MQKGDILGPNFAPDGIGFSRALSSVIDGQPFEAGIIEPADEIAAHAGQELLCGQRQARLGIGENAAARIARALPARYHHRNGDNTGIETCKERDEAIDTHRKQQKGACSRLGAFGDTRGEGGGAAVEFGEGNRTSFSAAVGQRDIGAVVGLGCGAMPKQSGQRGQRGNERGVAVSRIRHPVFRLPHER